MIARHGFAELIEQGFVPVSKGPYRRLPRSKYVVSPYSELTPLYVPARLKIDAHLAWFGKLTRPTGVHLTNVEYWRALSILEAEFKPFAEGGFVSIEEVVGVEQPNGTFINSRIDWNKSPGWPWVNKGCTTKLDAWKKFGPEIREMAEKLVRGEYVECVFIAAPKDELLKPGKKSRIFCPAPFHHQLACAMLFQKKSDAITDSYGDHASAIGMDIFAQGLSNAFYKLSKHPFAFDADHSGWDVSYRDGEPERDFMKQGLDSCYHEGVNLLFSLAQCPVVFAGGYLYQIMMQPSGWYLTTLTNTLKNYRHVCEAFMDIYATIHGERCPMEYMRSMLKVLCGGDDLAFSTTCPWFTITAYAEWASARGVYVESDVLEPRNAMDLTFFSHRLYPRSVSLWKDKKLVVAGGRLDKLVSSFAYIKKEKGEINYLSNAQRVVGLMMNLWAYEDVYAYLEPFASHLVYQFFLDSGRVLTPDWNGVFNSMPTEARMLTLWKGGKTEACFLPPPLKWFKSKGFEYQSTLNRPLLSRMQSYATPKRKTFPIQTARTTVLRQTKRKAATKPRTRAAVVIGTPAAKRRRTRRTRGGRARRPRPYGSGSSKLFPSGNSSRGRRTATVMQDEYIAEINGTTAFGVTSYAVNPGQAATFPWLSKEAAQWEKYHFEMLEFYYKPEVSGFATNGQAGKVILTADYDASDPLPTTKQQMEDTDPHVDTMPYQEVSLRLSPYEMFQTSDAKYVRTGVQPSRTDLKTYDAAKLNVGTFGNTNTSVLGELHVRYICVFSVPVLEPGSVSPNTSTSYYMDAAPEALTTTVPLQLLLATAVTNGLPLVNTAGSFVPPAGNYLVLFQGLFIAATAINIAALYLNKNGVDTIFSEGVQPTADAVTVQTLNGSGWVTANGTDAFTLIATCDGTGALTITASLLFTAV